MLLLIILSYYVSKYASSDKPADIKSNYTYLNNQFPGHISFSHL